MNRHSPLVRILIAAGLIAAFFLATALMLFLRKRMQLRAGVISTPAPTVSASATPTPSMDDTAATPPPTAPPDPTPFIDPETVQGGDRGLLVAAIQKRLYALGYYSYKPTGYFANMTQTSVRNFQQANALLIDGIVSKNTSAALFSNEASYALTTPAPLPADMPPVVRPRNFGESMTFAQADAFMPAGTRMLVVDLYSQLYFNAVRAGGENHMEIALASEEDMQRYLAIFSGRPSFDKRPCVVEFGGRIIAASLCGWLSEGTSGGAPTLCLYFYGSTAHGSALEDVEHNANLLLSSDGVQPSNADTP
jgi:hypothetical protein